MIRDKIISDLKKVLKEVGITDVEPVLDHPGEENHGDYSTNVSMILAKKLKKNPLDLAKKIVESFPQSDYLEKIEAVAPGFINLWLKQEFLSKQLGEVIEKKESFGKTDSYKGKKIVIEIVSPNINKPLHIGHLRNAALGMSLANVYQATGWTVTKDEINNDRGLHIMKAAYGYLLLAQKNPVETKEWKDLLSLWIKNSTVWKVPSDENKKPDYFVGEYYVLGEKLLTDNEEFVNKQLSEMLVAWEAEEKDIWKLWQIMSDWVHEGIDQTYKRIGVMHDKQWYEHKLYKEGKEIILDALKKGFFEKLSDGAIQANLEKYGLANKILMRHDGTAIYMTFDIALTKHKINELKADKYVWIVGSDQKDHFKRLFAIFDLLGYGNVDKFYHLAYGMVTLPQGKMSSRLGNVVLAEDLIDKMVEMAKTLMNDRKIAKDVSKKEKDEVTEAVGIGALKYAILKVNPMMDITFDLEKSVSLNGDSGPYIQYVYARCNSVLEHAQVSVKNISSPKALEPEELSLLRTIYKFPEIVEAAAISYAPNIICSYLFDLCQRYNLFYDKHSILKADKDKKEFRLALTQGVGQIIKNGLYLLGIKAPAKM